MTSPEHYQKVYNKWWHGRDLSPEYDDVGFLIGIIERMESALDKIASDEKYTSIDKVFLIHSIEAYRLEAKRALETVK